MDKLNLITEYDFKKYFIYALTNLCENSSKWLEYDYKLISKEDYITLKYNFTKSFTDLLSETFNISVFSMKQVKLT